MPRERLALGSHGNISTRKNEAGKWVADVRTRTPNGAIKRIRATGTSKYKAEQNLLAKLKTVTSENAGQLITPETSLTDLANIWFDEFQKENSKANTLARYKQIITAYIPAYLGNFRIRECSPGLITNGLKNIKDKHGYSSAKGTRTVLSNMFKLAISYNAIHYNPVRDSQLRKPEGAGRKKVDALTLGEVQLIRAGLSGDVLAVVDTMLGTGARIGEVLMLRWGDVDLTAGRSQISFTGTYAQRFGDRPAGRQEHTKSDSSTRTVFIPDELAQALRDRRANHIPAYATSTTWATDEAFIFPSTRGTGVDPNNFRTAFRQQMKAVELGRAITPHIFRKTVATLVSREDSLAVASQLLGHSSEKITEDYYIQKLETQPDVSSTLGVLLT